MIEQSSYVCYSYAVQCIHLVPRQHQQLSDDQFPSPESRVTDPHSFHTDPDPGVLMTKN
jgi:hypothetical protein